MNKLGIVFQDLWFGFIGSDNTASLVMDPLATRLNFTYREKTLKIYFAVERWHALLERTTMTLYFNSSIVRKNGFRKNADHELLIFA